MQKIHEQRKKGLESAHFFSSFPFCLPFLCAVPCQQHYRTYCVLTSKLNATKIRRDHSNKISSLVERKAHTQSVA